MGKIAQQIRRSFLNFREKLLPLYRFGFAIPLFLRYNPYTEFLGRRLFRYLPFLLPHDKSYYGFLHLVHTGDGLFLDVGANDGISALGFRHINRDYRILSIEPNLCHEYALMQIKRKLGKFDYIISGAGSENTEMTIHIPLYKGVPYHSAASTSVDFVRETVARQFPDHPKENLVTLQQTVKVIKLDELNLNPDIVKIDTEGYDYHVLLGLAETIKRCRPFLLVEFHPVGIEKVIEFFNDLSYDLFTFDHKHNHFLHFDFGIEVAKFESEHVTKNVFCIPSEKKDSLPIVASQK